MIRDLILSFALLGSEWVLYVLILLSIAVVAISAERVYYMIVSMTPRAPLTKSVDAYLREGNLTAFNSSLRGLTGYEARILAAGAGLGDLGPEAAEKAMIGTATAERLRMERGLVILATVGANAPFIGLLGTVIGIIQAFFELDVASGEATEGVMGAISESLIATLVGLAVAIPSVVLYNVFRIWVKNRLGRTESLADLVLARLRGGPPAAQASHGK